MSHKKRSIDEYRQVKDTNYRPPVSHENIKQSSAKFYWNDERVKLFCKLYSTNFNGIDEEIFSYRNYRGKKMDEKLVQFKLDISKIKSNESLF
jgi:hypothetical protein